jgi:DNA uptake protein ComE-like DNA-binding protein
VTWFFAFAVLFSFGVAAPILFAIAGLQARKRSWLLAAGLYTVLIWGGFALAVVSERDSAESTLAGLMLIVGFLGSSAHAFLIRPEYARRVVGVPDSPLEAARNVVEARAEAQRLAREEPAVALELGVGRPDVATARSMGVVDVNHASPTAIALLPGIDDRLATQIVSAREEINGFESLEDCGGVVGLDGNVVEGLRPFVVFLPR